MSEESREARKLVESYLNLHSYISDIGCAKTCAIHSVEKTIDALNSISSFINPDVYESEMLYWNKTKEEIELIC